MFDINEIGVVKVKKAEREAVARLRIKYPTERLFRIRLNNQESLDGKEPVTGCLNGDFFIIPREQDWVCPRGHLEVLKDAVFQDVALEEDIVKGVPVWNRIHNQRQRFHVVVYGELDLAALDKELAAEAKKAQKAMEKAALEEAKRKASDGDQDPGGDDTAQGGDAGGVE